MFLANLSFIKGVINFKFYCRFFVSIPIIFSYHSNDFVFNHLNASAGDVNLRHDDIVVTAVASRTGKVIKSDLDVFERGKKIVTKWYCITLWVSVNPTWAGLF